MAVGKNKRKAKKAPKRRTVDPFAKKEWYEIRAPNVFTTRSVGHTVVNRTQGMNIASEAVKGRVFEVNLADLQGGDEDQGHRKIALRADDVQGKQVLTQFYGMDFTTDKLRSLVRKWHTLIEAHVDVKTTDGFILRLFCIGLTKRRNNQVKRTAYAQSSQIRAIRKKMVDIITREASTCELKDLVVKFIPESIGKQIEKECQGIYPLSNVFIRKVKMVKSPKFDAFKLAELHGDVEDAGKKVEAAKGKASTAAPVEQTLVGE